MPRIVVTRKLPGGIDPRTLDGDVTVWEEPCPAPAEWLRRQVEDAEGVLTMLTDVVDEPLLAIAGHLRVVSQMAVGVDNVDVAACTRRRIPVGHTPGVLTETTADTAWALLSAAVRRLPEGAAHVRAGEWGEWDPELLLGGDLHDSTLGIVGLGRIGAAVARRAGGFRMRVLYTGPRRKPRLEAELRAAFRTLDELLRESDAVVLTAPLTPSTHRMIDAGSLAKMGSHAVLVNVSRGALVDHDALTGALRSGGIAAAALDVTDPEPIPADHPLVSIPTCLIVPHIGSASVRTRRAMAELALANLAAGLDGVPLPACANPEVANPGVANPGVENPG